MAEYDLEMDVAGPREGRRHQRAETIRSIGHIKRLRLQQNSRSEMVLKSRERAVENAESEPAVNSLRSRPWTTWCIYGGPTTRVAAVAPSMAPQAASVFSESERLARALSTPLGRPGWSMNEGERRPLRPKVGRQHRVGVGPAAASLPLVGQGHHDRPFPAPNDDGHSRAGHRGTASSFGDVPSHTPHAVPGLYGLVNEISRCRALSGSAFGSRYEGGATPPAVENVDPGLVDVRPLRGVAPPSQQSAV